MRWILLLIVLSVVSCSSAERGPYSPTREESRDPERASMLNQEASSLMQSDPQKAESLLREALTCDLYHGASHNNLGVIYLEKGELYEAANEFEWARKLLPGHPDPRMNLGLTLERGGRIAQAIERYRSALEVVPEHMPTVQALARLIVGSGGAAHDISDLVDLVAMRGEDESWRAWAKGQQIRLREVE